jgi:hypothetical protein
MNTEKRFCHRCNRLKPKKDLYYQQEIVWKKLWYCRNRAACDRAMFNRKEKKA